MEVTIKQQITLSAEQIGQAFQELSAAEQEQVFNEYIVPEMTGYRTGLKNACTVVDNLSQKQKEELIEYIRN